jgi:hypothetical protein
MSAAKTYIDIASYVTQTSALGQQRPVTSQPSSKIGSNRPEPDIRTDVGVTMHMKEMLLLAIQNIVGEECWAAVGGEGTGSVILLSMGAQILRPRPIRNPHLSELCRLYDSAYSLRIRCPWRIDSPSQVISGSHMSNANDGPMVRGLEEICGEKIVAVICTAPAFDVTIEFENQRSLVIHCTEIGWEYDACYSLGTPGGYYSVGFDGDVSFEE